MCLRQELSAATSTSAPVLRTLRALSAPIATDVSGFFTPNRHHVLGAAGDLPLLLLMGLPLLPMVAHLPIAVTSGLLGLASAGFAYQLGRQQAFLDAVPHQAQGLAFGLYSTGIMTGQGLGPIAAGALASSLNAGSTMALAGSAIVVASLLLAGTTAHRRRRRPG